MPPLERPTAAGGGVRARALSFTDQALSSATNFGGSALAAGLLTASDFGAFSVAVAVTMIVLGISRAWAGNVLMIVAPTQSEADFRASEVGAAIASLVIGVAGSVLVAAASLAVAPPTRSALLTLACCLPFIVVQDSFRYAALSHNESGRACISDAAWMIGLITFLMILRVSNTDSLVLAVLAANATAALGLVAAHRRVIRRVWFPRLAVAWFRQWAHLSARLTGEFLVATASSVVPLVLVTALNADLQQAGALRGAQSLLGPVTVVFAASTIYFQPTMVRVYRSGGSVVGAAVEQSAATTVVAVGWTATVLVVPDSIGVRVFGASWDGTRDIVGIIGVSFIALALSSGPLTALRSRGQLNAGLISQLIVAIAVIVSMVGGGLLFRQGLLRGFAFGNLVGAGFCWLVFLRFPIRDLVSARRPPSSLGG